MYELVLKNEKNRINTDPRNYGMVLNVMLDMYTDFKDKCDERLLGMIDVAESDVKNNKTNEDDYLFFCTHHKNFYNLLNSLVGKQVDAIVGQDDEGVFFVFGKATPMPSP